MKKGVVSFILGWMLASVLDWALMALLLAVGFIVGAMVSVGHMP